MESSVSKCNVACCSVDPFTRKDWYDIKAPSFFEVRNVGKTLVNRTQGLSAYLSVDFCWVGGNLKRAND